MLQDDDDFAAACDDDGGGEGDGSGGGNDNAEKGQAQTPTTPSNQAAVAAVATTTFQGSGNDRANGSEDDEEEEDMRRDFSMLQDTDNSMGGEGEKPAAEAAAEAELKEREDHKEQAAPSLSAGELLSEGVAGLGSGLEVMEKAVSSPLSKLVSELASDFDAASASSPAEHFEAFAASVEALAVEAEAMASEAVEAMGGGYAEDGGEEGEEESGEVGARTTSESTDQGSPPTKPRQKQRRFSNPHSFSTKRSGSFSRADGSGQGFFGRLASSLSRPSNSQARNSSPTHPPSSANGGGGGGGGGDARDAVAAAAVSYETRRRRTAGAAAAEADQTSAVVDVNTCKGKPKASKGAARAAVPRPRLMRGSSGRRNTAKTSLPAQTAPNQKPPSLGADAAPQPPPSETQQQEAERVGRRGGGGVRPLLERGGSRNRSGSLSRALSFLTGS